VKLAVLALLALQGAPMQAPSPGQAVDQALEAAPAEPTVEPYPGPLAQGLDELTASARADERERALGLAASLLASPQVGALSEPQRARLRYDVGLARAFCGAYDDAVGDLRAAAGLAGPGELREDSLYAAGTARLLAAEEMRLKVPEIAKELGLDPPMPPGMVPGGPPIPDPSAPDPLELARTAYLSARSELLTRVKLDWRDEDTRANLELVARRLRELDEIERQRKEEQQQQQQQQQEQQDKQDQQKQDQPQDQKQDPSQEQQPPEEQQGDPEQEPPKPEEGEQPPEPEKEEPSEQQEDEQAPKPDPSKLEERVLSKEEVQRLLDRLQEIEEQAQALRAFLRDRRRVPVEKDW
jgi:hypothetical protein